MLVSNISKLPHKFTVIFIASYIMSDAKSFRAGLALAMAFFAGMLSSSLATPLYSVYRKLYDFSASQIMIIFGVYAAGVLVTLILTSRIKLQSSCYTLAIYFGLICVSVSSLLMFLADNIIMLVAARFITGVGSGILMAYVNRSLLNIFNSEETNLAALNSSLALVIGQALGPVVSGNALHYHFFALHSPFVFLLLASVVAIAAVRRYASVINQPDAIRGIWQKGRDKSDSFALLMINHVRTASAAIFLSWAMASTFMSQGPTISQNFYGLNNTQQVSYCLSAFLAIAGITQLMMRRVRHLSSLNIGIAAQVISMLLLLISSLTVNSFLLTSAVLIEGFAYGAILVGAAAIVNRVAIHSGKAHLVNFLYIIGYIGNWLPMILSIVMDQTSLKVALTLYISLCLFIAVAVLISGGLTHMVRSKSEKIL